MRCQSVCLFVAVMWAVFVPFVSAQDRRGPFTDPVRSVRSREIDQRHIRLDLRFDMEKQAFTGRARLTLAPFKAVSTITLDAADMQVKQVSVVTTGAQPATRDVAHEKTGDALRIDLGRPYALDEQFVLQIEYAVTKPRHGAHFVAPDESEPAQPRMVWTQSEPEYARYWFPCFDTTTDRVTSEILVTVPAAFTTLSNGALKSKTANADGTQTWHWDQKLSHVPYLLSVVAGDFEEMKQEWEGIPILSYTPKGRLADAPRSFGQTPEMMALFSRQIGVKYPWAKYAQICVDEYMWGGMEHTSATTLTDRTLHDDRAELDVSSENLVAHELVHQWFGDLVTCKDWGELWLNESFATYFATLWREHDQGWNEATWERHKEALDYQGEDKQYRRSIVNYQYRTPDNMFDDHSYPKGGRVLHMLRFVLGDELFWKAIKHYVATNQHRVVETADLRRAIEDATGQGLNWFFDQWIHRGGHPDFVVEWAWDETAKSARVTVKQTQKVDDLTPIFRMPVEIEMASRDSVQIRRVELSKAEHSFHFQCEQRPTRVCFDPRDWLLKTLTFEKSKEELLDQLANDTHVMPRAQAAQGLAEFAQDKDVQAALAWAAKRDPFWGVRQEAVKVLAKQSGDSIRKTLLEIATGDAKSFVRREALTALGNFKHDETKAALRKVVAEDQSYYAVAEALKALVKVDRDGCSGDLLEAVARNSHEQVVLKAACDGLADLKHALAEERLLQLLNEKITPERRAVLISALARLKPADAAAQTRLVKELENDRTNVRRVAIEALVSIGDPSAISTLVAHRAKEESPRMIRAVDAAVERLQAKERSLDLLQRELNELRQQNKKLEERLKKLESAK